MFIESVIAGLMILTYWETYVAALEYLAIVLIPMGLAGFFMETSDRAAVPIGCLGMFVMPLLQIVGIAVFVLTLAPIILGMGPDADWGLPWRILTLAPSAFLRLIGILAVTAFVLALIPFINLLDSLGTLLLGGITLMFVTGLIDTISPGYIPETIQFFPGFWFSAGLLLVGGIMSWIGMMTIAFLLTLIQAADEGVGSLIMPFLGAVFGFFPVFIYGAWLGVQIT